MSWRKNTRLLGLMLAVLVVSSVIPGFLIPVKAQGPYIVTIVDPADGILYVNQSHTVVLNVTENGTAVAGLNVTLAWDINNTLVAVWNTTNATGFVTFQDFMPNQTGTLYVFVNGTYTNTTLSVKSPTIEIVAVSPTVITQSTAPGVTVTVVVKYGFNETVTGANVTITSPSLKLFDFLTNTTIQQVYWNTTVNGVATIENVWTPVPEPLTVTAYYKNTTDTATINVVAPAPENTTYVYGWVRVEGTLARVANASVFVSISGRDGPYLLAGTSNDLGEFVFPLAVNQSVGIYLGAYKEETEITTTQIYDGMYVTRWNVTAHHYVWPTNPGYALIEPGTSSVQTNVPIRDEYVTTSYANVTLPYYKVDFITYPNQTNPNAGLIEEPAAHTPEEAPVLIAKDGNWLDVTIHITDSSGQDYNFTKAMEEGINFDNLLVNVSVNDPDIAIVDNGTYQGAWVLVPIDPDTGIAKVRVWSAVDPDIGITIDNVGLVNVSNVLAINTTFDFTADEWNIESPNQGGVYNLTNYTLAYFAGVGHVSGDVTDHSGAQVPGATVVLQVWNGTAWINATDVYGQPAIVTSASDGHYAIDNIMTFGEWELGPLYRVKAIKNGAVGYSWEFIVPLGATATADVKLIGPYNVSGFAMYDEKVANADNVYFVFKDYSSIDFAVSVPYIASTIGDAHREMRFASEFNTSETTQNDVIISVGGPLVNQITEQYEDIAPVHMVLDGNITIVTPQGNFTWVPPTPWWNATEGYFIIQIFEDSGTGALVVTIYGTDADSTAAGAYYFMSAVYPNLDDYNGVSYIVGLWEDTEPGADYSLPAAGLGDTSGFSEGDSITIVAQG